MFKLQSMQGFEQAAQVTSLPNNEFRLECQTLVQRPIEEVFEFFADAKNLARITPPWLNFKILSQSTEKIQEGTTFEYALKVKFIPIRWKSLISDWKQNAHFVDQQLKGPYSKWHHLHKFEGRGANTLMGDTVHFRLPLGIVGKTFAGAFVKKDVRQIFDYRAKVIASIFSNEKEKDR